MKVVLWICCLGSLLFADFTSDTTKKIVIDNTTKLTWQNDTFVEGQNKSRNWAESLQYCEALSLAGKDDWRLPNINELLSIVDYTKHSPSMDVSFQNKISNSFWSSSTDVRNADNLWGVSFVNGNAGTANKSLEVYVRCVRGGQSVTLDTSVLTKSGDEYNVSVQENSIDGIDFNASMADVNFSIVGGSDMDKFDINTTSGIVSFKTPADFENPHDTDEDNSYKIVLNLKHSSSEVNASINIKVTDIFDIDTHASGLTKVVKTGYARDDTTDIVNDYNNSLMWQDDTNVTSVLKKWITQTNYDSIDYNNTSGDTASTYCSDLTLGGYDDWYLPNIDELKTILDTSSSNNHNAIFDNADLGKFWSSSTYVNHANNALGVNFDYGRTSFDGKFYTEYVRCVRSGQFKDFAASVAENQTAVTTINAPDATSFSLVGNDKELFSITNGGVLSFNTAPDYEIADENNNSYDIQIIASKADVNDSINLIVNVTDIFEIDTNVSGLTKVVKTGYARDDTTDIVNDYNNSLMWQDDNIPLNNWENGKIHCSTLDLGGYVDWYLPNEKELLNIAINKPDTLFQNHTSAYYWTSNTDTENTSNRIYVNFSNGTSSGNTPSSYFSIGCVRKGQFNDFVTSINENETTVTTINTLEVTSYTLDGEDKGLLSITNSGVLTFNQAPDYESKNNYTIKIIAKKADVNDTINLTINITDIDETPATIPVRNNNGTTDTDGDGIPDKYETDEGWNNSDSDSDGNGIIDENEYNNGKDTDNDGIPDFKDDDNDGDGKLDSVESSTEDEDGDGIVDYLDGVNDAKSILIGVSKMLKLTLGDNKSLNNIISNITLPTASTYGTTISWESSDTTVLSNSGTVTRGAENTQVVLTATITKGSMSYKKRFVVNVLGTLTDTQSILRTQELLNVQNILANNSSVLDVKSDLILDTTGIDGASILWGSSDTSIINNDGTFNTKPSIDTLVNITATISKGGETPQTKVFQVLVKAYDTSSTKLIGATDELTIDNILGSNRSGRSIISNLDLNTSKYHFEEGVSLTFESSDTNILTNDGNISRGATNKTVTIKAIVTNTNVTPNERAIKEFEVVVKGVREATIIDTLSNSSSSIVENSKNKFTFNYKESSDENLSDTKDVVSIFNSEDTNTKLSTDDNGNKSSTLDKSNDSTKIKEVKTTFNNIGTVETTIQVRKTTDMADTDIKQSILKSEIVDMNLTRNSDGTVLMNTHLDNTHDVQTSSDIDGIITQIVKDSTKSNTTTLTSKLRGSNATVKEDGTVEIVTPILKVNSDGLLDTTNGIRDISIKLQSDKNGSISNQYAIQSDTNSSIQRKVNVNIPSSIKGTATVKDDAEVVNETDSIMETQSLTIQGRKVVIYTTANGKTKTKFMNADGTDETFTAQELPFNPNDNENVNITIDTQDVDGVQRLKLIIKTPLTQDIIFN